uniref:apolipoprotein(a)-like n=1 Tax=Styela clava TaxID=7725 RepID=UPI00193AAD47|nr:apolipoprotein(a)-like [Styela clava]
MGRYLVLLSLFLTLIAFCESTDHGFMIFHEIGIHGGMCLFARKSSVADSSEYEPFLSTQCSTKNEAWRWVRYKDGILMNLYTQRCLGVKQVADAERIVLLPCDRNDNMQKWICGGGFSLKMGGFVLSDQLVYDNWQIRGSHPTLRTTSHEGDTKWIVYTQNDVNDLISLCDIAAKDFSADDKKFLTVSGGPKVGVSCVFPFIFKNKEVWSCIDDPVLSAFGITNSVFCSTTSNLDRNQDDWGICPKSKQGSVSDWIPPPLCDVPCGEGNLIYTRSCLYEPCEDMDLEKVSDEPCNTMLCSGDRVLTYDIDSNMFPVDDVYPVEGIEGYFSKCIFPFINEKEATEECVQSKEEAYKWCSLTEDFDKHSKWGICSESFQGAWSTWSTADDTQSCSKSCGSGVLVMTRKCRYSPCEGFDTKEGGICNTQPCPDCYDYKKGAYQGHKDTANDGSVCKQWSVASNIPEEDPLRNPNLVENYCRKPLKSRVQPYCYILDGDKFQGTSSKAWMYCDIPQCGVDFSLPGISYTVPAHPYDDPKKYDIGAACHFPFPFGNNQIFDRCVPSTPTGREWCRTTNSSGDDYAYCPRYLKGKWSEWRTNSECTKKCGGGNVISYRICLNPPCEGHSIRQESDLCNTLPCTWSFPGFDDCFIGVGLMYSGKQSKTITGEKCQHWSSQSPVKHKMLPNLIPMGTPALEKNYCRNPTPDLRAAPWCYTGSKLGSISLKWEYCDAVKCPLNINEIFGMPVILPTERHSQKFPGPKSCIFPFPAPKRRAEFESCRREKVNGIGESITYCAIENTGSVPNSVLEGLKSRYYGICPKQTEGTSGQWIKSKCSKTCGGGFWIMTKQCLHPPCKVLSKVSESSPCNTHECMDCFVADGSEYHGTYQTTYTGKQCSKWEDTPAANTNRNLKENFCRNPDFKAIPWCYSGRPSLEVFCDPKHCITGTIPYTIPQDGFAQNGEKCYMPYENGTDVYWNCQKMNGKYYCPIIQDVQNLRQDQLALCPPSYKGSWSHWRNTKMCNETCGGGGIIYLRDCLYPPCEGKRVKYEEECNTHSCKWKKTLRQDIECFMNRGHLYNGRAYKTISGKTCMNWIKQSPHRHEYTHDYRSLTLDHNYCRNPSSDLRYGPWCFTTDKSVRWEYCDVPHCPSFEGEIVAFPPSKEKNKCIFPFLFDGRNIEECTAYIEKKNKKKTFICGTTSSDINLSFDDGSSYGYCTASLRGTWSAWAVDGPDSCSVKCGGGKFRYGRKCRFHPCSGPDTKVMGSCNTQPCKKCYNLETGGYDYEGDIAVTWNDGECAARKVGTKYTNQCRNTDPNNFDYPWCIEKSTRKKVACGIKHCYKAGSDKEVKAANVERALLSFCKFPFEYQDGLHHSCIKLSGKKGLWCILSHESSETIMGQCFSAYEDTWSSWSENPKCSKPCAGGENVYTRYCRYPPCNGAPYKMSGRCNAHACDPAKDCYDMSDGGRSYNGNHRTTVKGLPCKNWPDNDRKRQLNLTLDYSQPWCRNPGGKAPRPFCINHNHRYELCNVPVCPDRSSSRSVSSVLVRLQSRYMEFGYAIMPCIFPFIYKQKQYQSCTSEPPPKKPSNPGSSGKWCATVGNINLGESPAVEDEFGYCDDSYIGTWVAWAGADKSCTADCYVLLRRFCILEPCKGEYFRMSSERCDDAPCKTTKWATWTAWSKCERCSSMTIQTRTRSDGLVESKTKVCETERESDMIQLEGACKIAASKHNIDEEMVLELLAIYMSRLNSAQSLQWSSRVIYIMLCVLTAALYY